MTPAGPAGVIAPAQPGAPGGVCQVPGIGDIGGLLGFCAAGSSGLVGDLNNICQPSVPAPEAATGGIDALIRPPDSTSRQPATLYDSYGVAGQSWAAFDLQCSDMTSLIGNNVAGVVFDAAKALDRVTITVYQSAAGEGILSWLSGAVDNLITWNVTAPRLGFTYDLTGNGKTVVKANYALYWWNPGTTSIDSLAPKRSVLSPIAVMFLVSLSSSPTASKNAWR